MNVLSPPSKLLVRWGRTWVIVGAGLFILSTAFPLVASLIPVDQLPSWVGYLDVIIAFALILLTAPLDLIARKTIDMPVIVTSYRLYRVAAGLPLVLLATFFLFGDGVKWNILLPGLAWRTWLLLYILPATVAAWRYKQDN